MNGRYALRRSRLVQYCNQCGSKLPEKRARSSGRSRAKLHSDIAHPLNPLCRKEIQTAIVAAYQRELERAKQPGYAPQNMEDFDAGPEGANHENHLAPVPSESGAPVPQVAQPPAEDPPEQKEPPAPPSENSKSGDSGGFGILA